MLIDGIVAIFDSIRLFLIFPVNLVYIHHYDFKKKTDNV